MVFTLLKVDNMLHLLHVSSPDIPTEISEAFSDPPGYLQDEEDHYPSIVVNFLLLKTFSYAVVFLLSS